MEHNPGGRAPTKAPWHEGGDWANVERRLARFPPWTGEVLTIDAARPLAENLAVALDYITR